MTLPRGRKKPRRTPDIPPEYVEYQAVFAAPDQGATAMTVSLRSRESANKLLRELRDADSHAKDAHQKGEAAFADAVRLDQAVEGLTQREAELRGELDQLQLNREEARQRAEDARAFGKRQHADRDEFADQAADARMFLDLAGISVDPDLLVPMSTPNGVDPVDPAGPTRVDLSDDPRMTGPLNRFHEAHDELPADQRDGEKPL